MAKPSYINAYHFEIMNQLPRQYYSGLETRSDKEAFAGRKHMKALPESKIYKIKLPFVMNGKPYGLQIQTEKTEGSMRNRAERRRKSQINPPFMMLNGLLTRIHIYKPPYTNLQR